MKLLGKVDKTVFGVSVSVYTLIFLFILLVPAIAEKVINSALNFTMSTVGWVYILSYAFIIIMLLGIGLSKFGKLRLGKATDRPEYSFMSWTGMLTIAGLGCGLLFFGVNEPVSHFMTAPFAESGSVEAAADAMRITYLHWSFLPWACYAIVGLCMGYFSHRKGLPFLISSSFQPMLGERINRVPGKLIDAFSLIAIICGISMSVGFAATQASAGLTFVYNIPTSFFLVAALVSLIGLLGTLSAVGGIAKGIQYANNLNLYLIIAFLIFTFFAGSSMFLIKTFFQTMGDLVYNLPWIMFYSDSFGQATAHVGWDWVGGWTIFYWAWWVAFAPFVGGFLAQISKGRTIREFAIACTVVPGMLCCVWFTFFGGEAIRRTLFEGSDIAVRAAEDSVASLFIFLQDLPFSSVTIPIAIALVLILIITSVNSAVYVAGNFCAKGDAVPSFALRIFWGIFIVLNTILFFSIGGLGTLKNTAIVLAFPFIIITLFMIFNLLKDLKKSYAEDFETPNNAEAEESQMA